MDLLILGASARAAAFSALRIGLDPACADLFADRDLARACPSTRIDPGSYPLGLDGWASAIPPTPWIYTGALENRPDLVDRIARRHPLLGNAGATLTAVRDPVAVAATLRAAGLVAPEVRIDPGDIPGDGTWLVKPRASAGGRGIRPWFGGEPPRQPSYYQEFVRGIALAAIFVAEKGDARLVGVTRQWLVGSGTAPSSVYRGSLGPWPVAGRVAADIEGIGRALASAFGLVGIFGVDLVEARGRAWPVEVNPRYTASVEVLEWALGRSVLADHLRACGLDVGPRSHPRSPGRFVAKAILRAPVASSWPPGWGPEELHPGQFPDLADVPHPGTRFEAGEPVVTAFASGDDPRDCRRSLAGVLRACRARLLRDR